MEKKYKLKTDGQPISMPCTKEQWEELKPELDEIEGVSFYGMDRNIPHGTIIVNNFVEHHGIVGNLLFSERRKFGRTYLKTHDKEAFLNSLRGEPIVKEEVKQPVTFTPPYRLGIKQKRAVLDDRGNEVVLFPVGQEIQAQEYVDFLNKKESPFNGEYWEKLYHECAVRLWIDGKSGTLVNEVIIDAKALIQELKNKPLK